MRAAHINRDRAHTNRLCVVTPEAAYIDRLLAAGRGDLADWPLALEPEQLGLTRAGGKVGFGGPIERLSPHRIRSDVSRAARQWLAELQVFPVIDSTNSALLERSGGFAGCVYLAECQTGGRGRRGRAWFSPLARNLALSAGFSLKGVSVPLDGLSLTVGLAVIDALDRVGLRGLGLKWPNDVYVDGRKLCGILVEVVPGAIGSVAAPAGLVVGIGINYELPESVEAAIDQHTTDVLRHGRVGRNALAAGVISSLWDFMRQFQRMGFGAMRETWLAYDVLKGHPVEVTGPDGVVAAGVARGVDESGYLLIETAVGVQAVGSGEVSVRATA